MQLKSLIFCADDWGMSPGINAGILELARNNLLFSVSCMANSPYLTDGLLELLSYQKDGLQFHIHFNLTHGHSGSLHEDLPSLTTKSGHFYSMKKLMFRLLTRQVSQEDVRRVFLQQLKILTDHDIPVVGLDGHHHIHLLPSVYTGIKKVLIPMGIRYVRTMVDPQHMMSFLQTVYFKIFLYDSSDELTPMPCGYVLAKNLRSPKEIKKKMIRYKCMITHPAKFNDFKLVGMSDKLQEERVVELKLLLEYLT
jgi:predicted glycoside hydrolase/deacetylase ChbG (UPF0249 family)